MNNVNFPLIFSNSKSFSKPSKLAENSTNAKFVFVNLFISARFSPVFRGTCEQKRVHQKTLKFCDFWIKYQWNKKNRFYTNKKITEVWGFQVTLDKTVNFSGEKTKRRHKGLPVSVEDLKTTITSTFWWQTIGFVPLAPKRKQKQHFLRYIFLFTFRKMLWN